MLRGLLLLALLRERSARSEEERRKHQEIEDRLPHGAREHTRGAEK
jgi:hypothetical protein